MKESRRIGWFFGGLFAVTLALRLCHSRLLWVDEDYHLAAGIQTLFGKLLYRDLWYDKPPLAAWIYAAIGGAWGWPLRLFDAVYVLLSCAALYRFGRDVWGQREGLLAAGLLGFFLNFDHAFAVIPIASDLYFLLPHILAVHAAWRGKPVQAGIWCGVAMLLQTKGLVVLAVCMLLAWRAWPWLLAGFAAPNAVVLAVLGASGAWEGYIDQVWRWGAAYAASSSEVNPVMNGIRRTADWMGFHAALVMGAIGLWWEERRRDNLWLAAWLVLSFAGAALGLRFFPRYFYQVLPPLVLMAARGAWLAPKRRVVWAAAAIALAVPLIRFGPRYFLLARDTVENRAIQWSDVVLDQDSHAVAARLESMRRPGDTLFVWGYRPDLFVYSRMPSAGKFWDSQPLTGVPADRHLHSVTAIVPEWSARNREEFARTRPVFVVDSLSLSNPRLAIGSYPELREWMTGYREVGRTGLSIIYQLTPATRLPALP